jgi:hypothetical protein
MKIAGLSPILAVALAAVACGEDPISYSAPVTINLKAKPGDVKSGSVSDEKGITSEAGNPYGAFVADAKAALGGRDPSRVEVAGLRLFLGANSKGVSAIEQVFDERIEVLFVMNESNNSHPVGHVDAPTGSGPIALVTSFDSATLGPVDYGKLLGGSFKVVIRGAVTDGFEGVDGEADLQLTFTFAAYE